MLISRGRRRCSPRARAVVLEIAILMACGLVVVVVSGAGSASTAGLRQLSGAAGCLTELATPGCGLGRALRSASWVTVSPDGRNVYLGAEISGAVDVFARARPSGALVQLHGSPGCVAEHAVDGCAPGRGLQGARPVAVSPDGRDVYVGALHGVVVFRRDPRSGVLRQLAGRDGCMQESANQGCAVGRGIAGVRGLAVSPDGRTVYVAAHLSSAVAVLARDLHSGALRQLQGGRGCVSETRRPGCSTGRGLLGPRGVLVSPDRRFVYVPAEDGGSVAVFERDLSTGALTQLRGVLGCLQTRGAEGCATARALRSAHHVALSPDARYAYLASATSNAVAVLRRDDRTGVLQPLGGASGCVEEGGGDGCAPARALDGAHSIAVAADHRLYVAAPVSNAVAMFAADPRTGTLRQLAGPGGCIATGPSPACATARALIGAHSVALSPDGRNLYAAAERGDAILAFATK